MGPPNARVSLCLDCYVKVANVLNAQGEALERDIERLEAQMYETVGLSPPQRLMRPPLQIHTGPLNVSNIDIRGSNIGVLNTGTLSIVDSCISVLNSTGNQELSTAIVELTDEVIKSSKVNAQQKNEILELISGIASEAVVPKQTRRRSVLMSLIRSLATAIGTTDGLMTIWEKVRPIVEILVQ